MPKDSTQWVFLDTIDSLIARPYCNETTEVTVTRALVWQSIIILALLKEFLYDYRGNNTYVIQEKTALNYTA